MSYLVGIVKGLFEILRMDLLLPRSHVIILLRQIVGLIKENDVKFGRVQFFYHLLIEILFFGKSTMQKPLKQITRNINLKLICLEIGNKSLQNTKNQESEKNYKGTTNSIFR